MEPITILMLDDTEEEFIPTEDHRIEEVLRTICEKHGLDPSKYVLSFENYFLSNDFRLKTLNIQKNQYLKLARDFRPTTDMLVTVTLRIKDSYVSANFHPNVTLWKIVENLVAAVTLKIPRSTPILIRKGVEYIGEEDLMKVTPRSLGYTSGFLFFRFLVIENAVLSKRTGGLLGSSESLQFELNKEYDEGGSFVHRVVSTQNRTARTHGPVISFYPGIARRNSSVFGEINYLGDRNAVACRLPSKTLSARQRQRRDNFYDMHFKDVQTMFKLIEDKRKELEERKIKQVDPEKRESTPEKKFTVIRIQFPDKTVLQGFFDASETIRDVAEFVKLYRRVPRRFQLIIGPPSTLLRSAKTLADYNLVPTGKMFYKVVADEMPMTKAYLKESVLRRLTTQEGACYAAALCHQIKPENGTKEKKEEKKKKEKPEPSHAEEMTFKKGTSLTEVTSRSFMLRPYESRVSYFRF